MDGQTAGRGVELRTLDSAAGFEFRVVGRTGFPAAATGRIRKVRSRALALRASRLSRIRLGVCVRRLAFISRIGLPGETAGEWCFRGA